MNYCNKTVYVVGGGHIACFDNRRESRNRYYFPYDGGWDYIEKKEEGVYTDKREALLVAIQQAEVKLRECATKVRDQANHVSDLHCMCENTETATASRTPPHVDEELNLERFTLRAFAPDQWSSYAKHYGVFKDGLMVAWVANEQHANVIAAALNDLDRSGKGVK